MVTETNWQNKHSHSSSLHEGKSLFLHWGVLFIVSLASSGEIFTNHYLTSARSTPPLGWLTTAGTNQHITWKNCELQKKEHQTTHPNAFETTTDLISGFKKNPLNSGRWNSFPCFGQAKYYWRIFYKPKTKLFVQKYIIPAAIYSC